MRKRTATEAKSCPHVAKIVFPVRAKEYLLENKQEEWKQKL